MLKQNLIYLTFIVFLEVIVKTGKEKTKSTLKNRAITAAIREHSFSSQLLLSLSVFTEDMDLKDYWIFYLAWDLQLYEISTVYHPHPRVLSSESGIICWR